MLVEGGDEVGGPTSRPGSEEDLRRRGESVLPAGLGFDLFGAAISFGLGVTPFATPA